MQVLNLKKDFEVLSMHEDETISKYSDRISAIINEIRSLGEDFLDSRVVENVLVTLPERFESKISSLEESKDLTKISLAELMSALQAQQQTQSLRQEIFLEGSLQAQNKPANKRNQNSYKGKREGSNSHDRKKYPPCKTLQQIHAS